MSDVGSKRVQEWDLGFLLSKSGTLFERQYEERIINNIRRLDGINESVTHQRYGRVKEGFVVILQTAYLEQALRESHEEKLEQLEKERCPAQGEHQELSEALKRVEELQKQIAESERTTQLVADKAIQREQKLRAEHKQELDELRKAKAVLLENKGQLEERVRLLERDDVDKIRSERDKALVQIEELKRADKVLPDRGPWLHRRGDITTSSYDDYCNEILEDAQKILLDPNCFPFLWKERTGQELDPEEAETWARVGSPFD